MQMKKTLSIVALTLLMVMLLSSVALAMPAGFHPPVRSLNLPESAKMGLHEACGNLDPDGIAFHVFLFMLAPANHR